jgi:hypothetical protein
MAATPEIQEIRAAASGEVSHLVTDPLWVAGTTLYWADGAMTSNRLSLANSDPRTSRLYITWARAFVASDAAFVLKLNLHFDNSDPDARTYWTEQLSMPDAYFYKTFVKPEGTGHRRGAALMRFIA